MPVIRIAPHRWCRLLPLLCLAVGPALAADRYDFSAVDQQAQKAISAGETPSIAFAIAKDGKILHSGAFGLADREAGRAATVHTAYPLASATKPITATALMVLHERQGLDLDATLRTTLPDLPVQGDGANAITLMHLLTHTSGLGTYARIRYGDRVAIAPPLLDDIRAYAVEVNRPGRIAEYSNLGYGLLGEVAARHAKRPFATVTRNLVFEPLGMRDAFVDTPREGQVDVAAHYDATLARLPPLRNNTPGAGNAYASATDLIRFAMLHAGATGKHPLSAAGVAAMQSRHGTAFHHYYGDAYYGLGWYVRQQRDGQRMVWHEGGMPGASSIIQLLPAERIAVVVLGNRTDANVLTQSIANELIRAVMPNQVAPSLDPVAGYAPLSGQPGFAGTWRGVIRVDGQEVESSLVLAADGAGTFRYGVPGQTPAETSIRAMVNGDSLISALPGRLPSRDIGPADEPLLLLKLVRDGDRITGAVVAYSSLNRLEYLLPFAIRLQRQPARVSGHSGASPSKPAVRS